MPASLHTPSVRSHHAAGRLAASVITWAALAVPAARAQVPPVPVPVENPLTAEKAVLGKILFWDEQLSTDNTVACGTCHLPEVAGSDPRPGRNPGVDGAFGTPDDLLGSLGVMLMDVDGAYTTSPVYGTAPQVTGRTAPTLSMAAYAPLLFWDGRAGPDFFDPLTGALQVRGRGALEAQAVGPILNDVEMAHPGRDWDHVTTKLEGAAPLALGGDLPSDVADALATYATYPELFAAAFGDPAITPTRIAFAIASYERTIIPNDTPFDRFQQGNPTAMTPQEVRGMQAFNGSTCDVCHRPPLFTDFTFRNVGVRPVAEDSGREGITGAPPDRGRFKVPSLRNVGLKTEMMHNGQLTTLQAVLDFYRDVGPVRPVRDNLDPLVLGVNLNGQAAADVVAFLEGALTDERAALGEYPFDRPSLSASADACRDGVDNDGDGLRDLLDGGCFSAGDTSEHAHDLVCDDGLDNDGDGITDGQDADCDAGVACLGASGTDTDGDGTCDDLDLVLEVTALSPGELFTAEAVGAAPGMRVVVLVSTTGAGEGPCHPLVPDVCASVRAPIVLGTAVTDGFGVASLTARVPATVPVGRTVWVQALAVDVVAATGEDSNVVVAVVVP
jgi:cytochrome c peroxidase